MPARFEIQFTYDFVCLPLRISANYGIRRHTWFMSYIHWMTLHWTIWTGITWNRDQERGWGICVWCKIQRPPWSKEWTLASSQSRRFYPMNHLFQKLRGLSWMFGLQWIFVPGRSLPQVHLSHWDMIQGPDEISRWNPHPWASDWTGWPWQRWAGWWRGQQQAARAPSSKLSFEEDWKIRERRQYRKEKNVKKL